MKLPEALDLSVYQKAPFRWTPPELFEASRDRYVENNFLDLATEFMVGGLGLSTSQMLVLSHAMLRGFHAGWFTDQLILPTSQVPIQFKADYSHEHISPTNSAATRTTYKRDGDQLTARQIGVVNPDTDSIEKFEIFLNVPAIISDIKTREAIMDESETLRPYRREIQIRLASTEVESSVVHEVAHAFFIKRAFQNPELWARYVQEMTLRINTHFDPEATDSQKDKAYHSGLIERNARMWERSFISHYYPDSAEAIAQQESRDRINQLISSQRT